MTSNMFVVTKVDKKTVASPASHLFDDTIRHSCKEEIRSTTGAKRMTGEGRRI
jgi:hypothetical protein